MALIVEYHVVADMYPVGNQAISAGMLVSLANGVAVPTPIAATAAKTVLGIAGDSALAAEGQTTAYSAQVTIGANGAGTRFTSNRVSDFYDETAASQKITVYNGGGKFWISEDLFDDDGTTIAASSLLAGSATVAGEWNDGAVIANGTDLAIAVGANQAYDSGVPGTATANGSMSLGNFVPIVLRI